MSMAERAREKNLDDPAVWKEAGDQFFGKGDYEAASMNYVRAIELNPDYLDAWNGLSLALRKMGRMDEADHALHIVKDLQGEGPEKEGPHETPAHEEVGHEKHPPDYARLEREKKNPVLAAIASVFFAGLGQIYNGQNLKGFLIFFGTIFGVALLIVPGVVIWLFGIYDAYVTAKKMRYGKIPYKPANLLFVILYFVILVVVGVVLAAAILAIFSGLHGSSPLSLLNITGSATNLQGDYTLDWLENRT
jgi:TM2 domain-containing membrane protein YozV